VSGRYEVIIYPLHFEVIDHANDRLPVYETRRIELARRECRRLNRENSAHPKILKQLQPFQRAAYRGVDKHDAAMMLELAKDPLNGRGVKAQIWRRAFHRIPLVDLADAFDQVRA
jgi:hypothetical protein